MTNSTDKKQRTQNTKMMGLDACTGLRAGNPSLKNFFLGAIFPPSVWTTQEQQTPSPATTTSNDSLQVTSNAKPG